MPTETQTPEVVELSLEKTIETKLVQSNVTEQVLLALKETYGGMKLKSLDDKESYLELKAAAKECAKVRTLTVKICKEGREEAVKTQKLWIAKEKEVVGQIAEVEDALDAEVKKFDDNIERLANEEKQRQESAYINRQATLTKMGATYADGCFVLGEASFEAELVKGASQNIWDDDIIPKFNEEYQKIEAVRIAEEKKKEEAAAELKRQQDELARQQEEFKQQQAELQRQKEESDRKEKERQQAEQLRIDAENDQKFTERISALKGWSFNGLTVTKHGTIFGNKADLFSLPTDEFNKLVEENVLFIKEQERIDQEKRQAAIELANKEAIKKEQERLAAEEAKKQAELESANDKTKWEEFIKQVKSIDTFDMRSGQYRTKMQSAKDKIQQILAL